MCLCRRPHVLRGQGYIRFFSFFFRWFVWGGEFSVGMAPFCCISRYNHLFRFVYNIMCGTLRMEFGGIHRQVEPESESISDIV